MAHVTNTDRNTRHRFTCHGASVTPRTRRCTDRNTTHHHKSQQPADKKKNAPGKNLSPRYTATGNPTISAATPTSRKAEPSGPRAVRGDSSGVTVVAAWLGLFTGAAGVTRPVVC